MMTFWPHWQRPFFLVILPIILWLLWKVWHTHQIKGSWQNIIPVIFQPWLLRGTSVKESIIPKIGFTLACILAFLALLGPSWQHIKQPPLKIDSPLIIVLDLTPRMLANDVPPSRLQSAKLKVLDIIKAREDAQTAVIVYSNTAHILVPLSDDEATITNLLTYISPEIMPSIGQRADLAIAKAITLLANTQQINEGKILLVTSGLSDEEQAAIKQILAKYPIALNILGVGTSQGAPIISPEGGFIKDAKGEVILPKLEANILENFAYSNKGRYSTITLNNNDIHNLNLTTSKRDARHIDKNEIRTTDYWQDQGYWLLLPLLALVALAARKGWLFCLPLLLLSIPPQPANAFEWNQLWLNKDQQGQHLLKENKPAEAAKRFKNKQWQGYSSYESKNYQRAEKLFANETSAEGIYNYGNSLARQGKYQEAIEQWDKAIKVKTNFSQAIKNKKLVEELLKKKQQEKKQQEQQQVTKDQSSNKQANNDSASTPKQQSNRQQANNPLEHSQQQQNISSQASDSQDQGPHSSKANTPSESSTNDKDTLPKKIAPQASQLQHNDQQQDHSNSLSQEQTSKPDKYKQKTDSNAGNLEQEQKESIQQWMRTIPDDPSELLRRKFYYEQHYKGDNE